MLDLKPYVPYTDAHPAARSGWLDVEGRRGAGNVPADPVAAYQVMFNELADAQAAWIEERTGLPIRERIEATLALGPEPHPYRRIRREGRGFRLAVKDWRVRFVVAGREVQVLAVASGYRAAQLAAAGGRGADPVAVHREFSAAWPS